MHADARGHLNCRSRFVGDNNNNRKDTMTMSRNADRYSDEAFTGVVKSLSGKLTCLNYGILFRYAIVRRDRDEPLTESVIDTIPVWMGQLSRQAR